MMAARVSAPTLAELLAEFAPGVAPIPIRGIALDSRRVEPGDLFLALRGARDAIDAHVREAIARGAVAICCETAAPAREFAVGVAWIELPRLQSLASAIAGRFYGEPSRALDVIGVTGTNGKTTVTWLIAQALNHAGVRSPAAVIGTLGYGRPGALAPSTHTTPDAVELQRVLAQLRGAGDRAAVIEVSSHALVQQRAAAVRFDVAVLTNLSRDHLDYHGDFAAYAAAKAQLFARPELDHLVLNLDDGFGLELCARHARLVPVCGYTQYDATAAGIAALVRAVAVRASHRGMEIDCSTAHGPATLTTRLVGRFNVGNLLAALATLLALDVPLDAAVAGLASAAAPPGRLERFGGEGAPLVLVDYAHTPDALANVLRTARSLGHARLWCVFGCGGDRDRGKRAQMGAEAARLADVVVLTNDNPRNEDPQAILDAIESGITSSVRVVRIPDRAQAIRAAVTGAGADDVVVVAGKGHEDYQVFGSTRIAFSDRAEVLGALRQRRA